MQERLHVINDLVLVVDTVFALGFPGPVTDEKRVGAIRDRVIVRAREPQDFTGKAGASWHECVVGQGFVLLDLVVLLFGDVALGHRMVVDLGGELVDHGGGLVEGDELREADDFGARVIGQGAIAAEDRVWSHDALELVDDLLDGARGSARGDHDLDGGGEGGSGVEGLGVV